MSPKSVHGKICYLEIPAIDSGTSAGFYAQVFGWRIRQRGDGATAFDDTTGEVSGAWVVGRTVRFSDPAGNVIGLYQEPERSTPTQSRAIQAKGEP